MSEPQFPQRPLSPQTIADAVHLTLDSALAQIPVGQHGALLGHVDLLSGQPTGGITIAEKLNADWAVAFDGGITDSNGRANPSVGFAIRGSW